MQGRAQLLDSGAAALAAGDWPVAVDRFEAALVADPADPDALAGLGNALWWTSEVSRAIQAWERAYAGFRRRPDTVQAILTAVNLSLTWRENFGNHAAAQGWATRAQTLADQADIPVLRGWVLIARVASEEAGRALAGAREALAIALEHRDVDLELCARATLGQLLLGEGRVAEGQPLLDEAMVGALSGECESLDVVVFTSCVLVKSCYNCGDFPRVVEWTRALGPFIERYGSPYLNGKCRAHLGAVLVATGDWTSAERELRAALGLAAESLPEVKAEATTFLADLRLSQGRIAEAAAQLESAGEFAVARPVLAELLLVRREFQAAVAVASRMVEDPLARRLDTARSREILGTAALLLGDHRTAEEQAEQLREIGARHGCAVMSARGSRLTGRVLLTLGEPVAGRSHLTPAIDAFTALEMPLEAARTRMLLAEGLDADQPGAAIDAARRALATFDALGAVPDADAAAQWLRTRGRPAPRRAGPGLDALTRREHEVLLLLAQGLSNPEIAARLYLSRRTVEHHVASILSKLGLRNRTEAASVVHAMTPDKHRRDPRP